MLFLFLTFDKTENYEIKLPTKETRLLAKEWNVLLEKILNLLLKFVRIKHEY